MQSGLLTPIRQDLVKEAERLRERLATIETAIRGIDAAIRLDLDADRPRAALGRAASIDPLGSNPFSDGRISPRRPIKQDILREALLVAGEVEAPALYDDLRTREPFRSDERLSKSVVSHALREGAEAGELVLIERGAGSRPARYKKAGTEPSGENSVP